MRTAIVLGASVLFAFAACEGGAGGDAEGDLVGGRSAGASGSAAGMPGAAGSGGLGGNTELDTSSQAGAGGAAGASMVGGAGGSATPDPAGMAGQGGTPEEEEGVDLEGRVPAILAAGYGGLRVFSLDRGLTWERREISDPNGGDDQNLIRAVGYANGVFLGVGWKIFRSDDGKSWTEVSKGALPGEWYDCVNFRNGQFIVKRIRPGTRPAAVVSDDMGKTWRSADSSISCQRQGLGVPGVSLSGQWKGKIMRSENGGAARQVSQECCNLQGFVSGMVKP